MTDPQRIAIVTSAFPPTTGGVPTHTMALASHLGEDDRLRIDVLTHQVHDKPAEAGPSTFEVRRFPTILDGLNAQSPAMWAWIARHSDEYDVVHVHGYHTLTSLPATLLSRTTVVFTPHYHGTGHSPLRAWIHPLYRRLGSRIMGKAAAVICVSDPEASLLVDHFPFVAAKVTVIPNGIEPARIRAATPIHRESPFLLVVGRLEHYKQVDRVIEALPHLEARPDLVIVGSGPASLDLARLARECRVEARVTFLHDVSHAELYGLMRAAHTVVTMSTQEAFGMVLAEGVAAGARVVASDIAAHRYVVTLGERPPIDLVPADIAPTGLAVHLDDSLRQPRPMHPTVMPSWAEVSRRTSELYEAVSPRTGH